MANLQPDGTFLFVYLGPATSGGTVQAIARLATAFSESFPSLGLEIVTYRNEGVLADLGLPVVEVGPAPASPTSGIQFRGALRQAPNAARYLCRIRRAVRDRPNAVVLPFLTGTALVTLAATIGLPNRVVICERNDTSIQPFGWHVRLLRRLLYPRAAAITVNSANPAASELLRSVSHGREVHVVPNPHPREIYPADPANSFAILAVGRLVAQKRHTTLIDAFAVIADKIPAWSVIIVGEGPLHAQLVAQIERLGLGGRVTLAGQVDDPRPYYASAGLFVLSSDYEGTSNALLEAASAGLPCIVTTTAAPAAADNSFRVFPPGDVMLLARHLQELCDDEENRRADGVAARNWLRNQEGDVLETWIAALAIGGPP